MWKNYNIIDDNVSGSLANKVSNKQDKLTNPLTKSDVVNNLTTTTTNVPLSAAQGKALNDNKADKSWTLVNAVSSVNRINVPSSWNELLIILQPGWNTGYAYTWIVPKDFIYSGASIVATGFCYNPSNDYGAVAVSFEGGWARVFVHTCSRNGSDLKTSAKLRLYSR